MSTELVIVRQGNEVSNADLDVFRRVLYALTDGLTQEHAKRWRRFWNWIVKAEPGEMLTWLQHRERSTKFHRRHFKLEAELFDAQERFEDPEDLRTWLKVGAGFVTWAPGAKGGIVPLPKSMRYSKLDEDGMQELHAAMVAFMRTDHATKWLWPHIKTPAARSQMVESVLAGFNE